MTKSTRVLRELHWTLVPIPPHPSRPALTGLTARVLFQRTRTQHQAAQSSGSTPVANRFGARGAGAFSAEVRKVKRADKSQRGRGVGWRIAACPSRK